ncbi:MAG: lysylphosphatidylglycerol synthase transmembrane domain-containing protein [archaeon]
MKTKSEKTKGRTRHIKKRYLSIIGIILIVIVLRNIDLNTALATLRQINIEIFLAALALQSLNVYIKSEKWRLLISPLNKSYKAVRSINVWLTSYAIGIVTPGRIGDFTRAIYLKKDTGLSYGKSISTVFIDRLQDTVALFIFAYMGLIIFNPLLTAKTEIKTMTTMALLAFTALITIILKKDAISKILRPLFNSFIKEEQKEDVKSNYLDFYRSLSTIAKDKRTMIISSILTLLSWIIILIASYLIALSINIHTDIIHFIFLMPIIYIVELIPISISGIGTRDATTIILFSLINIRAESAFVFSTLILLTNMIFALIGLTLMQINTYNTKKQLIQNTQSKADIDKIFKYPEQTKHLQHSIL